MISVIVPALNAERTLPATLTALVPAAVEGVVRQVIVVDGGSRDRTRQIAEHTGADVVESPKGRGLQLAEGAKHARFPWLLFLHADTVLAPDWDVAAAAFMARVEDTGVPAAAAFRFKLDDRGVRPRLLEAMVAARCKALALPYGDQGLLIPKLLLSDLGGYRALPIMEDVDLVRRLGRKRLTLLNADAVTSAERYKRDGYMRRSLRNQMCLALYGAGLSPERIARLYEPHEAAR